MRRLLGTVAAWLLVSGCSEGRTERPLERVVGLEKGVVARVGDESIPASFVAEVARRHGLEPRVARDRVVGNALLAKEARERLAGSGLVQAIERTVWAEALLDQLRTEAEAAGPATAAELASLRRAEWVRLDRPVSVSTVHAVALVKKPEQDEAAREVAERILAATKGLTDPERFEKAARAVPSKGIEKRVEYLPFLTPSGRVVQFDPGVPVSSNRFDKGFAAAANAIAKEGDRSSIVKTPFGYHVILLIERVDAQRYTDDDLRRQFASEVVRMRADHALKRLTSSLEERAHVDRTRNFERLTAHAWEHQ